MPKKIYIPVVGLNEKEQPGSLISNVTEQLKNVIKTNPEKWGTVSKGIIFEEKIPVIVKPVSYDRLISWAAPFVASKESLLASEALPSEEEHEEHSDSLKFVHLQEKPEKEILAVCLVLNLASQKTISLLREPRNFFHTCKTIGGEKMLPVVIAAYQFADKSNVVAIEDLMAFAKNVRSSALIFMDSQSLKDSNQLPQSHLLQLLEHTIKAQAGANEPKIIGISQPQRVNASQIKIKEEYESSDSGFEEISIDAPKPLLSRPSSSNDSKQKFEYSVSQLITKFSSVIQKGKTTLLEISDKTQEVKGGVQTLLFQNKAKK